MVTGVLGAFLGAMLSFMFARANHESDVCELLRSDREATHQLLGSVGELAQEGALLLTAMQQQFPKDDNQNRKRSFDQATVKLRGAFVLESAAIGAIADSPSSAAASEPSVATTLRQLEDIEEGSDFCLQRLYGRWLKEPKSLQFDTKCKSKDEHDPIMLMRELDYERIAPTAQGRFEKLLDCSHDILGAIDFSLSYSVSEDRPFLSYVGFISGHRQQQEDESASSIGYLFVNSYHSCLPEPVAKQQKCVACGSALPVQ